jgi:CDI immunity proteins
MDEIHGKSLEELDGKAWGDPPADATGLIERVHRLRSVKLRDLSEEDIATLLGQREGADWLVPLVLDRLTDDPLAGDWHPGQLLLSVLRNGQFFERFPNELLRLHSIRRDLMQLRDDAEKALANPGWPRDI